jgi:hypothetical protein
VKAVLVPLSVNAPAPAFVKVPAPLTVLRVSVLALGDRATLCIEICEQSYLNLNIYPVF